jgi:mono/diheme cytochrome c family protein
MNICCPICATSIEVSKFLVGHKGRCPNCASKFIIPETPDGEIEILERGTIPADAPAAAPPAPEPVAPPVAPAKIESLSPPPAGAGRSAAANPAVAGPRRVVTVAGGAPVRTAARPVVVKQSSGAFGFLFAIVLAALVGVIVYVMMDKKGGGDAGVAGDTPKPEAPVKSDKPVPARPVVPVPEPEEAPEVQGFPVYAKVIQPILADKCVSCHGEEKRKGRLAMHTFEALSAGGGNGPILEADKDDVERIELLFRAGLPEADEEHMPPQGKPQLTPEEIAILKWWIDAGAHEDTESNEAPDNIRATIESQMAL